MGQALGWRSAFLVVTVLALLTVPLVAVFAPRDRAPEGASSLRELGALGKRQVWLTLGIGAIGFGGIFAVYTYLTNALMEVTHVSADVVPLVLAVFGIGLTVGNLVVPSFADRALMRTGGWLLVWSALVLALFTAVVGNVWFLTLDVFLIGCGGAIAVVLQTRLMDVAGDAQALAAALNHSAFNTANALGPLLGGLAISAGYGRASTGWVGAGLVLGGLVIWAVAVLDARRISPPVPAE